jgi:endonuclease/exonuclease/phosphatase family metal-dependent hydrolase
VIRELAADVVALQEVPLGANGFDMLAYLRDACGLHAIAGPTLKTSKGDYGNAILTRFSAADIQCVDLSVPRREPRGAIAALLDCHGMPLRLIATHLGLRPAERRHQIRRLLLWCTTNASFTVLLGDLNDGSYGAGRCAGCTSNSACAGAAPGQTRARSRSDLGEAAPSDAPPGGTSRARSWTTSVSATLDFDAAHLTLA